MLTLAKTRPSGFPMGRTGLLSTMDLFQKIPFDLLREIEKFVIERRYIKRESIFQEDDPAEFVWFVKEGHVKEIHLSTEGRDNTLCLVGPNGIFGVSSFDGGTYDFHSVAETDVTVVSFPIRSFRTFMEKCPDLSRAVLSKITKLLRQSRDMQVIAQESAEKRLLHVLMELVVEFGNTVPLSRKEIASMAGTTVETCIRTFSRLEEAGFIASGHGKTTVKNAQCLKNRMEEL